MKKVYLIYTLSGKFLGYIYDDKEKAQKKCEKLTRKHNGESFIPYQYTVNP